MKKNHIALLLSFLMIFGLAACGSPTGSNTTTAAQQPETSTSSSDTVTVEPEAPFLEFTGTFVTSVGDAEVIMKLGSNGVYSANASHSYGSVDFASGTWAKADGNIVLTDNNGNTYTSTNDGTNYSIQGTWDVGSMLAQEITVTVASSSVEGF